MPSKSRQICVISRPKNITHFVTYFCGKRARHRYYVISQILLNKTQHFYVSKMCDKNVTENSPQILGPQFFCAVISAKIWLDYEGAEWIDLIIAVHKQPIRSGFFYDALTKTDTIGRNMLNTAPWNNANMEG